jgi:hypothetical protein
MKENNLFSYTAKTGGKDERNDLRDALFDTFSSFRVTLMPKDGSKLYPDDRLYKKRSVKSPPFMQFFPVSSKDHSPCEK